MPNLFTAHKVAFLAYWDKQRNYHTFIFRKNYFELVVQKRKKEISFYIDFSINDYTDFIVGMRSEAVGMYKQILVTYTFKLYKPK